MVNLPPFFVDLSPPSCVDREEMRNKKRANKNLCVFRHCITYLYLVHKVGFSLITNGVGQLFVATGRGKSLMVCVDIHIRYKYFFLIFILIRECFYFVDFF